MKCRRVNTTMDFLFTKGESEDSVPKHEVFDAKYAGELLDQNWSNPSDILDSIFSMDNDFLNNYDQTGGFETLEDLSEHMKIEAEEYEMTAPSFPTTNEVPSDPETKEENDFSHNISSNSSDSGLSSDNVDVEMSPAYEPLSPTMSSPGPSISERGEKKDYSYEPEIDVCSINPIPVPKNPKVIVKKVPQVITLPANKMTQPTFKIANGKEIKIVKLSPQMINAANNKKVTIQVKNSSSGAKLQANPGTFIINNGKLTEVKKLVRVQNVSNPRSVLLPLSVQEVKDLKTFKIINPSVLKTEVSKPNTVTIPATYTNKNINKSKPTLAREKIIEDSISDNTSDAESYIYEDVTNDNLSNVPMYNVGKNEETKSTSYPKLILTPEEKRLLAREGITLPANYPLTKHEERELKRIRRKIRNKISAQDSRKRKKEYVDGLEERVKQCTEENQTLMKRIKLLQSQNQNLMSQMKKLQSLLSKGTNKTAQPTTCLMVLLLSLALIAAPNLKLGQNVKESELEEVVQDTILQNRRNLLFDATTQNSDILDEEINMSEIFSVNDFNNDREYVTLGENCKHAGMSYEPSCKKPKFIDFDVDDMNWYHAKDVEKPQKSQSAFNHLAQEFQVNRKSQQTSGFNINRQVVNQNLLDKDILDMVSPTSNGLYELNMEKLIDLHNGNAIIDVTNKYVYAGKTDEKSNSSELRHVQKY